MEKLTQADIDKAREIIFADPSLSRALGKIWIDTIDYQNLIAIFGKMERRIKELETLLGVNNAGK